MISIVLRPGPAALPETTCLVHVTLHNDGTPVAIDNPAALLDLPQWRIAWEAEAAGVVIGNWQNFEPPEGQMPRLDLGTGDTWEAMVPLRLSDGPVRPGVWWVSLRLDTPDGLVESEPCGVEVAPWRIAAGHAGHAVSASGTVEGDALLLQVGDAGGMLYRMPWGEDDSDRTGHGGAPPIPLRGVGPTACDPLVPVRDSSFWQDPARWLLWREGAEVHGIDTSLRQQSLILAEPPARLLRPALQRRDGPVELFSLSADCARLDLLRFSRTAAGGASVAATIELGMAVADGCAGFAPDGGLLVGMTATDGDAVILLLHHGGSLRQARLADASLLPASPPALLVQALGGVVVATLVQTDGGVAVARVRFDALGTGPIGVTPIGSTDRIAPAGAEDDEPVLPRQVIEAALLLIPPHADGPSMFAASRTAFIVLRLDDGSFLRLDDAGRLEETMFEAQPVPPMTLVRGDHGAFLLACDPLTGPFMAEA